MCRVEVPPRPDKLLEEAVRLFDELERSVGRGIVGRTDKGPAAGNQRGSIRLWRMAADLGR
jgi:hypothetical protein